jgi:pimeloyl-ACP methyl ester carboxylesterase
MLEFMMPGTRAALLRRLSAPVIGALFGTLDVPAGDLVVEAEAECAFDARDVREHLRRVQVPVLLVYGEADEYIPRSAFDETAAHISDCTVVSYPGLGHRAVMTSRVPQDVLAWAARRDAETRPATTHQSRAGA